MLPPLPSKIFKLQGPESSRQELICRLSSLSLPSPTAPAAHATAAAPAPAAHAAAAAAAVGDLLAGLVLGLDRVVDEQGVER